MNAARVRRVCGHCQSEDVTTGAVVYWDVRLQDWQISGVLTEDGFCETCEQPCDILKVQEH